MTAVPKIVPAATPPGDLHRRSIGLYWLGAFACAAILFALTANRGVQWQDSGYHILRIVTRETVNPLGLALSHPLHHWLGRLAAWFDLVEPCFAVTLVSSFAGAIAVANTFGCVATLTRSRMAAVFAAVSLALAHTFWQMATLAETYTLVAALLSGECWCLVAFVQSRRGRFLCAAFLLNGLGVSNHLLAGLTTPVLAAVLVWAIARKVVGARQLLLACLFWIAGVVPYAVMVLGEWARSGDAGSVLRSAFFGHGYADEVLNTTITPRGIAISFAFIGLNFPNLLLPIALYGIARARAVKFNQIARRVLLAGLLSHAVFVLRYSVIDQHTFFVPMYVIVAIFGGRGFAEILRWPSSAARKYVIAFAWALILLTPLFYAVLPGTAKRFGVLATVERHRPYRDDYVYIFTPWSVADESAERMSREAVALAAPDGWIFIEDRMAEFAVRYQVFRKRAHRVEIRSAGQNELIGIPAGNSVVWVPANVNSPPPRPDRGAWKRAGELYLLDPSQ